MASKLVLLALLVAVVYCASAHPMREACGPNEVFDTCGSACPSTCRDPAPDVCVLKCHIGCRCQDGFVRNVQNECVLLRNC